MHAPVLVTPPAQTPITLDDVAGAKAQARVDGADEDGLIEAYIQAATAHLDGWAGVLGRALVTQTWRQDFPWFGWRMRLPLAPVQSVTVGYYDTANVLQTLDSAVYALRADASGSYVELAPDQDWPSVYARPDAVQITFVAGYGAAADVPAPIRQAIRMMVAHWMDGRSASVIGASVAELPYGVAAMIAPYRRWSL